MYPCQCSVAKRGLQNHTTIHCWRGHMVCHAVHWETTDFSMKLGCNKSWVHLTLSLMTAWTTAYGTFQIWNHINNKKKGISSPVEAKQQWAAACDCWRVGGGGSLECPRPGPCLAVLWLFIHFVWEGMYKCGSEWIVLNPCYAGTVVLVSTLCHERHFTILYARACPVTLAFQAGQPKCD